jgi:hypothetical protein
MPNRTFKQLQDAVKTEMQLDPGLVSDTERQQFINDCLQDLGSLGGFEKHVTLSFTDGVATLPADYVDYIALFRGDVFIRPATAQYTTNGFIPRYPQIEVRPHATEDLTFWYAYSPAALSADSDIPDIPVGYDYAIVEYAVARAHRKNGNTGLYREYMSSYENAKAKLNDYLTRLQNSRVQLVINNEGVENVAYNEELMY